MKYIFFYSFILVTLFGCRLHQVETQISNSVHVEDLNNLYKPLFKKLRYNMRHESNYILLNEIEDNNCCQYVFYVDKENCKAGRFCSYNSAFNSMKVSETKRIILNNLQYISIYQDYAEEPPLVLPRDKFELFKVEGKKVHYWEFDSSIIDNLFYDDNASIPMLLDTDSGLKSDLILVPFRVNDILKVKATVKVSLISPLSTQRQQPFVKSIEIENIDIKSLIGNENSLVSNILLSLKRKIFFWYQCQPYESMLDYHKYINSDAMAFDLLLYVVPQNLGICL